MFKLLHSFWAVNFIINNKKHSSDDQYYADTLKLVKITSFFLFFFGRVND